MTTQKVLTSPEFEALNQKHLKIHKSEIKRRLKRKQKEEKVQFIYSLNTLFRKSPFWGTGTSAELAFERGVAKVWSFINSEGRSPADRKIRSCQHFCNN